MAHPALLVSVILAALPDAETLRAEGPAGLAKVLAAWEAAGPGPEREALAALADRVAAQKYAVESGLYWYSELAAAQAAARASGRPILALRLLGRLDEELSCANSRFFRVALYANRAVSRLLRERFVLYWSSERPAPRLVVDYGDGRRIETTVTGNSAHMVLDAEGRAIDVLPGLYAPAVFRRELEASLAIHAAAAGKEGEGRRQVIAARHGARLAGMPVVDAAGQDEAEAIAAQRMTVSKAAVELPVMRRAGIGPRGSEAASDDARWLALGSRLLPRGEPILDASSRALIARLAPAGGAAAVAQFERDVVADTAKNELFVRRSIRQRMVETGGEESLEQLVGWLYATVFRTPAADAWLGLRPERFTGLPADGVKM
jgi:hypothetical protein